MLITDLSYYLESQGEGVQGTDIFVSKLPDNTNNCILLSQTGDEPEKNMPISIYRIQVLVRNKLYGDAYRVAMSIYGLLHRADDKLVLKAGGVDIMSILAIQLPYYVGQDAKERYIFSNNYKFKIRNTG